MLDRVLYSGDGEAWDGEQAWQQLAPSLHRDTRMRIRTGRDTPLPPLYPQTD